MSNVIELARTDSIFRKQFGVFVGMYNKVNGTKLSVKQALKLPVLISLFETTAKAITVTHDVFTGQQAASMPGESTRLRSYKKTDIGHLQQVVLDHVQANPDCTRREISNATGVYLNSTTARVRELIDDGLVYVSGEKHDHETDRDVETLRIAKIEA